MDPNRTLQMFSLSQQQRSTTIATKELSSDSDDDDAEGDADHLRGETKMGGHGTSSEYVSDQPGSKRPRLQEALEMSLVYISRSSKDHRCCLSFKLCLLKLAMLHLFTNE